MVISKTPFRMSFFGGGTDFPEFYNEYGGAVISTTIDKYCFVSVRKLPPFFQYKAHLTYSEQETVNDVDEVRHPLIRETMRRYGLDRIRLFYDADLPARSGLGTSSSFAVGMVNAFCCLKETYASKRHLADEAILLERTILNETGGIQDQIAAAFGGFNRISFDKDGYQVSPIVIGKARKKQLNENLMLFFTGFSRFSPDIQKEFVAKAKKKTQQLLELNALTKEAEQVLVSESISLYEFGRLLDCTWQLKRGLSNVISTNSIDLLYDRAIKAGAVGGKILGAGGGGFLLLYAEREYQPAVRQALGNLLYVPFEFESGGSQIIHYD